MWETLDSFSLLLKTNITFMKDKFLFKICLAHFFISPSNNSKHNLFWLRVQSNSIFYSPSVFQCDINILIKIPFPVIVSLWINVDGFNFEWSKIISGLSIFWVFLLRVPLAPVVDIESLCKINLAHLVLLISRYDRLRGSESIHCMFIL